MARVRPFPGLRPADAVAGDVIAPPYDVLNRAEARAILAQNPRSFLQVTRPDAAVAPELDEHAPEVYAAARAHLAQMIAEGLVIQDAAPCYYLYRQTWRGRTQTALMAACSVEEYDLGLIKRHELTRPDKEQDRVDHIEATDVQTGLVFLAYRDDNDALRAALAKANAAAPAWEATTDDGVTHALTVIDAPGLIAELTDGVAELPALYVADGHHRSAAASRVNQARGGAGSSAWFLAGLFPDSQLEILAYNRLVADLAGHSPEALRAAIGQHFTVSPGVAPEPAARGLITMYLEGQWWGLAPKPGVVPEGDPVGSLDVAVLQDRVLGPLLGIADPRTDKRIQFVGGVRGWQALARAVDVGEAAVAFHMFPTGLDQLFAVADAGALMPPKSTWFEPKLRGGVLAHRIA